MTGEYGIILLAAGASSRLGKPKQLLKHRGKTLLEHAVLTAVNTGAKVTVVVLDQTLAEMTNATVYPGLHVSINEQPKEGLSSSIRIGIKKLEELTPSIEAVIFMVCDQPFITAALLQELVERYQQTGKPIVASAYGGTVGIPALFDKCMFEALSALEGDAGAKQIMNKNPDLVDTIDFPEGTIDIDTAEDFAALQQLTPNS